MSATDLARIVADTIEQMAVGLNCSKLLALSYVARERVVRGVGVVGFEFDAVREYTIPLSNFPLVERALYSRQILSLDDGAELPDDIASQFEGETIIAPVILGDRPLAALIGLIEPGLSSRSASWQRAAEEVLARAALAVELSRVATAYHDEVALRQSRRVIGAAILEDRPLSEIGDLLLESICQRLRVERAALFVRDPHGGFSTTALRNISAEYAERVVKLRKPGPVMARAIATGLPYFARDVQNDKQFDAEARALFRNEHVSSVLIAALQYGDAYTGALVVYPDDDRNFTPAELSVFQTFVDQATMAVAARNLMMQQRDIAVMEERNRLAREMHDTVAQALAALVLQTETALTELGSGNVDSVRTLLETAKVQAKKGLEDTRRAVQGLSPASLDAHSTTEAIAELVRAFELEEGIATQFIVSGDEQPLLAEQSLALLRIAQEALNNAHKHAEARRVRVGVQFGIDLVTLRVEDDGIGFDAAASPGPEAGSRYGLFGMMERVRLLDGDLQIESTPGWGTRIQATLPYRPASQLRPAAAASLPAPPVQPPLPAFAQHALSDALRVVVVDDHAVMRQGLHSMLEATGEISVVGEARDGAEAVTEAVRTRPDVVLMDLQMPGVDGLEGLRKLQETIPDLPVVVLTTFHTAESVSDAFTAGARGFMLKDAEPAQLVAAIRAAHRGEALLSPAVTDHLADLASSHNGRTNTDALADPLNERELEVLEQLAHGARNKEIAEKLFIVPRTVEYHLANIYAKLGVSNRTEAAREAMARGLVAAAR
jgi:DNA-binding NarL/FixJ family response regulator/signal transduction histidine kinase